MRQSVSTRPPSITKSDPVTLPARSLASSTTRSATSWGSVKRPVAARRPADRRRCRVAALRRGDRCRDAVVAEPQLGRDRPGADRVDADAARTDLLRQRLARSSPARPSRRCSRSRPGRAEKRSPSRSLTIVPRPASSMPGRAARVVRTAAMNPKLSDCNHSSSVTERNPSSRGVTAPTLLTSTSSGPSSSAEATSSAGPSAVERSTPTCRTWPPSISWRSSSLTLREPATTLAPSATSALVMAKPIPLLAPVTRAHLPVRPRSIARTLELVDHEHGERECDGRVSALLLCANARAHRARTTGRRRCRVYGGLRRRRDRFGPASRRSATAHRGARSGLGSDH